MVEPAAGLIGERGLRLQSEIEIPDHRSANAVVRPRADEQLLASTGLLRRSVLDHRRKQVDPGDKRGVPATEVVDRHFDRAASRVVTEPVVLLVGKPVSPVRRDAAETTVRDLRSREVPEPLAVLELPESIGAVEIGWAFMPAAPCMRVGGEVQ